MLLMRHGPSQRPLAGARIWLSGSVPDDGGADGSGTAILNFVRGFARRVFERGGHVVHGSHPSIVPTLLEEAARYQGAGGHRDCLVLAVSRRWSKDLGSSLEDWRKVALVYETAEATGEDATRESLQLLRQWIVSRSDAIVVVGGEWWSPPSGQAGIPVELELAVDRGLPCFLLGGLGGAAKEYTQGNPGVFDRLRNGLDGEENRQLATREDVGNLVENICVQLERLPLIRGRPSEGVTFRILALDGGGLKGAFTASAIAAWEQHTGLRVVDHFDLIAGTSTGGILALGLGLGLTGKEMLDFYLNRGPVIFPVTRLRGRAWHTIRHILHPKYSQAILLRELEAALYRGGEVVRIKDSQCRLLIPTYHAVAGISHQFRTPHHPDLTADANTEAAHAALATSAAPTFFTAAKIANMVSDSNYFDGGVWANTPAMAAIIEAVCFLRIPLERLDVLSVGTTEEPFSTAQQTRAGIVGWLWKRKILELLMNAQQESSLRLARHLVSDPRLLRINAVTVPGAYALDSARDIGNLADLGQHTALKPEIVSQVKSRFLNGIQAVPWERFG